MPEFIVKRVDGFDTVQLVFKLVRNGKCRFDDFLKEIQGDDNLSPELGEIYAVIEEVANCQGILPPTRYKRLRLSKKLAFNGYEAKSKHLRVYMFQDKDTGQVIVLGGKKGDQPKDLERLEKAIREYTEYKRQNKK